MNPNRLLTLVLTLILLFFTIVIIAGLYLDCHTLSEWFTVSILTCGSPFLFGRPLLFLVASIGLFYAGLAAIFGWWPSNRHK